MSPKEKVRANIYKVLLEEEKRKNRRLSVFSVGLFLVGIVSVSTYNSLMNSFTHTQTNVNYGKNIALNKVNEDKLISSMYGNNLISNKKNKELNPDELFSFDTQI